MSIFNNGVTFFLATLSWSLVAFSQLMLKGGKLRFKWASNSLEIYVELGNGEAPK